MAIVIPLNKTNWEVFVRDAKKKGISVRSRYKGVYIKKNGKKHSFVARYQGCSAPKSFGYFSLSREGEQQAYNAYCEYLATIPKEQISIHKGRIIKSKISPS